VEGPLIQWFGEFRRPLLFMIVAVVFFCYAAGFTLRQTLGLTGCLTFAFLALNEILQIAVSRPYKVQVGLSLADVLVDLGVLQSVEDWSSFSESVGKQTERFESFTFTAIRPRLYARSDRPGFSSEVSLSGSINIPSAPYQPDGTDKACDLRLEYSFSKNFNFYEFRILVPLAFERQARDRFPDAPYETNFFLGALQIVLAKLPAQYFNQALQVYEPESFVSSLMNSWERKERKLRQQLESCGWKVSEDFHNYANHRYIGVSIHPI
jgi:hypothetical protein